jgi:hypothetical protein
MDKGIGRHTADTIKNVETRFGLPAGALIRKPSVPLATFCMKNIPVRDDLRIFIDGAKKSATVIDEYISLDQCPGGGGWPKSAVPHFQRPRAYKPSEEIEKLMKRFPPKGQINPYYSFKQWNRAEPAMDALEKGKVPTLHISALRGSWAHITALNGAWKAVTENNPPDPDCLEFRKQFAEDMFKIRSGRSRLYHNMNAECLVVTQDNYVVVTRRRGGSEFSHGRWSATLEEQVSVDLDRGDLFAAAHRGVEEELRLTPIPEKTRLLEFGMEFGNFTAAFLFLVFCDEKFLVVRDSCWAEPQDLEESVAIDGLKGGSNNVQEIKQALSRDVYKPSPLAKDRPKRDERKGPAIAPAPWHPIARARLCAYLRYLESQNR